VTARTRSTDGGRCGHRVLGLTLRVPQDIPRAESEATLTPGAWSRPSTATQGGDGQPDAGKHEPGHADRQRPMEYTPPSSERHLRRLWFLAAHWDVRRLCRC
jgi:hypothetical protein